MRGGPARKSDLSSVGTVSARAVWPALARLRALGLDPRPILLAAGADPSLVENSEARLPHALLLSVWREAAERSGDSAFGLHAAEGIRPGAFDVLDYAFRLSATLGEGLERLVRYHRLVHDTAALSLRLEGNAACLDHAVPADPGLMPVHIAEFTVFTWLVISRQATGLDFAPLQVNFRHFAPSDRREHERLFRAPVRFSQPSNSLVIERALLDAPLVRSDPGLCDILERNIEEALGRLPVFQGLSGRARHQLAGMLSSNASAEDVARQLNMSRSTMHRQLQREGTTFKQLLEGLRRELATRYLAEKRMAIAEVAFLLGFSETSAFHRAFKRWQGMTPVEFRSALSDR